MAEWLKAHDWKSCDAGMYPEVQILFSAPTKKHPLVGAFLVARGRVLKKLRINGGARETRPNGEVELKYEG